MKAPEAHHVGGFKCEECEHLHLALMDEDNRFIAIAVIDRDAVMGMLRLIDEPRAMTMQ